MTAIQRISASYGAFFIIIGVLGLATGGAGMAPAMMLGHFPVNLVHNLVHVAFGAWGLLASRSFTGARTFGQITGVIHLVLAVMGTVVPAGFGVIPLGSGDVWLHAALGISLTGFGFTAREEAIATG